MSTQREDVGAPDEVATLALAELADGSATCVQLGDVPVAVARVGDDVYAIADTCSHGRASLTGGEFYADEYLLECPKHGSTFDVRTGVPTCLPATVPVATFDVAIEGERITVRRRGTAATSQDGASR